MVPSAGALVTSANLTAPGFSTGGASGNIELGLLEDRPERVKAILRWIDGLDRQELQGEHLEQLREWHQQYRAWEQELETIRFPRRPHPPEPVVVTSAVEEALVHACELRMVKDFSALERGWGRQAYKLDLGSRRPCYRVRVLTSVAVDQRPCETSSSYHFNIARRDVESWHRLLQSRKPAIKGVLLVPIVMQGDTRRFDRAGPPPVLVPFDHLFRRGHVSRTRLLKRGKSRATPTIYLTNETGDWTLRSSAAGKRRVTLDGCLGSSRQARSTEWHRARNSE